MSKRDYITEIQEKNARSSKDFLHGNSELYDIEHSFLCSKDDTPTLRALHVMGVASCIEVGVREAIKRLVDHGEPYLERTAGFKDHLRFDFSLTKALSTQQITLGDLVSHLLPVSNLGHIAGHFEVLFNEKAKGNTFNWILSQLQEFQEPGDDTLFGDDSAEKLPLPELLIKDVNGMLTSIAGIFESRHLVAHEAKFNSVSHADLTLYLASARNFLDALYELVEQALNPGVSRSGYGGSIQNLQKAGDLRGQAMEIEERIKASLTGVVILERDLSALFSEALHTFDAHLEAESSLRLALAAPFTGNAMRNIEADVTMTLYQPRIAYLKDLEEAVSFEVNT